MAKRRVSPYAITLTLTVSDDDGDGIYVVTSDHSKVYGDARNPYAAVADYLSCLARQMDDFACQPGMLGPALKEEFVHLVNWAEGRTR